MIQYARSSYYNDNVYVSISDCLESEREMGDKRNKKKSRRGRFNLPGGMHALKRRRNNKESHKKKITKGKLLL